MEPKTSGHPDALHRRPHMPASAARPAEVTHGLTLKGAQLTWAIMHRKKTIENRSVRLKPGWLALHTGMGKLDAVRAAELAVQCPGIPPETTLAHGYIVGALRVDRACEIADCAGTASEPWASGPICAYMGFQPSPLTSRAPLRHLPCLCRLLKGRAFESRARRQRHRRRRAP